MAGLIRIGNSQGVRIPKALIEKAQLEGKELTLEAVEGGGLLIRPLEKARVGWAEKVQAILAAKGKEPLDEEWLAAPLSDETGWSWE